VIPAPAAGTSFITGLESTLVTAGQRKTLDLRYWPDGPMGVEKTRSGYLFHSPNGPNVARTKGRLDDPLRFGVTPNIEVEGARALTDVGYASGGPIYRDRSSGMRLMFVHAERFPNPLYPQRFYATVGLARSYDRGRSWRFLGEVFSPRLTYAAFKAGSPCGPRAGSSFGQFVVRRVAGVRYFYIYGPDQQAGTECPTNFAVARAPVSQVLAAAANGTVTRWSKYYNGTWVEPGLGGRSSDLWQGQLRSFAIAHNRALDRDLIVMARQVDDRRFSMVISESADGLSWSQPTTLFTVSGEIYAPTIVGRGNPRVTGRRFFVYYTNSLLEPSGGFRWDDGALRRRQLSVP
jgi:hypothetical protein